jgi:hypothetical protein
MKRKIANPKASIPTDVGIEVVCKRAGYRRAGVAHPKGAVKYPAGHFSAEQIEAFEADPNLTVRPVLPETLKK